MQNNLLLACLIVIGTALSGCTPATGNLTSASTPGAAQPSAEAPTAAKAAPAAAVATSTAKGPSSTVAGIPAAREEKIDVTHARGKTTVPLSPKRVVTFDYSVLDTLDQLGIPIVGVPQDSLPPFLAAYKSSQYTNVGTLFEPDYEKLNMLKPDLIIVAGRSSAAYEELSKLAPTIDLTVDQANFFSSFKAHTLSLASIFRKESEATAKLAAMEESIGRVKSTAGKKAAKGLIVLVTGGKVTAYGPGSRFGIIHDLLGVPPVTTDIDAATHGNAISFEFIQAMNPDLLYVIDRDSAIGESGPAAKQVLDNALVRTTKAWTNGAVTYLDPSTWYLANAGLGTFRSMIAEVEASLR